MPPPRIVFKHQGDVALLVRDGRRGNAETELHLLERFLVAQMMRETVEGASPELGIRSRGQRLKARYNLGYEGRRAPGSRRRRR